MKRKQGKRERQEASKKENEEGSAIKRAKTVKDVEDIKPTKIESKDDACQEDSNVVKEEATATQMIVDPKIEAESDEEDPEEEPEEDLEMQDTTHNHVPPEEARPLLFILLAVY